MMKTRVSLIAGCLALGVTAAAAANERTDPRPQGDLRVGDVMPQRISVWFPPANTAARGAPIEGAYGVVIVGDTVFVVDQTRRIVEVKR
jgi:ABC-type sugar transport system substrate-binding protein